MILYKFCIKKEIMRKFYFLLTYYAENGIIGVENGKKTAVLYNTSKKEGELLW